MKSNKLLIHVWNLIIVANLYSIIRRKSCAPSPALSGGLVLKLCCYNRPASQIKEKSVIKTMMQQWGSPVQRVEERMLTSRCHEARFEHEARCPPT